MTNELAIRLLTEAYERMREYDFDECVTCGAVLSDGNEKEHAEPCLIIEIQKFLEN